MKVKLEALAPDVTSGNLILGGYDFNPTGLQYTIVGNCQNNTKLGTGRGDQSFSFQQSISINNSVGTGVSTPHLQGFDASTNPLGKTDSSTDYTYRLYADGIVGKRTADANPRVRLNWSTAGIQLGAGGANTLTYGVFAFATVGLYTNSDWIPEASNTRDLGAASYRWKDCYLVNAPNVSSDASTKQQVRDLSVVEKAVAVKCKSLIRAYKLNSAVEKKGAGARIHFGAIAQEVKAAFESEGLDPFAYGLLCYDSWDAMPEQLDDAGNVTMPASSAGQVYSLRYEELLAFIIGGM
jgi:hypothetical protein